MAICMIKHFIEYCCCNPCSSTTAGRNAVDETGQDDAAVVRASEDRQMQWAVAVDGGVSVAFVSQSGGPNHIRRIRFSKEAFNKREAKTWWTQNSEKLVELYNIPRSDTTNQSSTLVGRRSLAACSSMPGHDRDSDDSTHAPTMNLSSSTDGTPSSTMEVSVSSTDDGSGIDEWEEQDEPGVSVTIRSYPNGTREIRHVNLSRERFNEATARAWWAENKARLHDRYVVFFVF